MHNKTCNINMKFITKIKLHISWILTFNKNLDFCNISATISDLTYDKNIPEIFARLFIDSKLEVYLYSIKYFSKSRWICNVKCSCFSTRFFSSPFRGRFDKAVFLARDGYCIKLNLKIVGSFIIKVQLE